MKKYELNGLGKDWIWEADSENEATKIYINDVCGAKTLTEYQNYCESVGVDPRLNWREYAKYGVVEYNGEILEITQSPYASSLIGEENYYTAMAEDFEGQEYIVLWPITNPDCQDESDACDWTLYNIERC